MMSCVSGRVSIRFSRPLAIDNACMSLKPKQVVELGGAMGMWSICVLHSLPEDSKLYSITLAEGGLEFKFIIDKYLNFHPIVGDDLDMKNWEGIDLGATDIWYIDSLHTYDQVSKELNLYSPFFKKGAILLFDDIHMPELFIVWKELPYDKFDATAWLHFSGFGLCII